MSVTLGEWGTFDVAIHPPHTLKNFLKKNKKITPQVRLRGYLTKRKMIKNTIPEFPPVLLQYKGIKFLQTVK
jgi:hypothetical protein